MKVSFVQYAPSAPSAPNGLVAYLVNGDVVVFTGLMPNTTSTINAAEQVVTAICSHAKLDWRRFTFVDMQTSRCYTTLRKFEHELSTLIFDSDSTRPRVKAWGPMKEPALPQECIEVFDALPWYEETPSTKLDDLTS